MHRERDVLERAVRAVAERGYWMRTGGWPARSGALLVLAVALGPVVTPSAPARAASIAVSPLHDVDPRHRECSLRGSILIAHGDDPTGPTECAVAEPTELATLVISHGDGATQLAVEIADTPEERAIGLMGREDLGAADGMAFLWSAPTSAAFWMRGTLIPLSVGFWDEAGMIVAILDMEPCLVDPCPLYSPGVSYWGAVEVARGAFDGRGIGVGDRVGLVSGFTPAKGRVGSSVVITGTAFTPTGVTVGGVATTFVADSPTQIIASVPPEAGTGPIVVTTGGVTAPSTEDFVVRHARSIRLRPSLARGGVWVADGWSGCASELPVRLQLQVGRAYRTVASAITNPRGAYRFGGIHEPGAYRVVARKVSLPTGDECLRAVSRVVTA